MAKDKGKKARRKGKTFGNSNVQMKKVKVTEDTSTEANNPVHLATSEATAYDPEVSGKSGASHDKEKKTEISNRISGFIFMCNPSTKIECYRYRVFGLPMARKEVLEGIKPGTKLFLFDFESKLLYGIYEATSTGEMNLEPAAFKGKFPAQVKFRIFKECLPMPESSLRNVIRENYTGSKFKQDLNAKLVRKLTSSFRPLNPSYTLPAPQAPTTLQPWAKPPSTVEENQFKHSLAIPRRDVPYIPSMQYSQVARLVEHQPVQSLSQHRAAYLEHTPQTLNHLPAGSSYYVVPNSRRPSTVQDVAYGVQNPSYSRTVEDRTYLNQASDLERKYLQLPSHGDSSYPQSLVTYNTGVATSAQYAPSSSTQQEVSTNYYMPLQRGLVYQDSVLAYNPSQPGLAVNSSAIPQSHSGAVTYHHQLPSHREATQQDYVANQDYLSSYYSHAYSASQPQVLATSVAQTSDPVSHYYYSYTGA